MQTGAGSVLCGEDELAAAAGEADVVISDPCMQGNRGCPADRAAPQGFIRRSVPMKKAKRFLKNILIFALILLLWELASGAGIWSAYVLPPPQKVCTAL
jgi:hypothetical protein